MKIAVCLSGQPRNFEIGLNLLKENLKDFDLDFYFHFWYDEDKIGNPIFVESRSDIKNRVSWVIEKDSDKRILETLNPVKYTFQKPILKFPMENELIFTNGVSSNSSLSMFFSRKRVGELLKSSEKKYDLVIWTRSDFAVLSKIPLIEQLSDFKKVYLPYEQGDEWNNKMLNTAMLISCQENIVHFLSLYDYLHKLKSDGVRMNDHDLSFAHMRSIGCRFEHILEHFNGERSWMWIRNGAYSIS